jgi:DNA polymerase III subunit epsilon
MKLFYCDVETGGTDCSVHALLQLAYLIEIDGKIITEGNTLVRPGPKDVIVSKALEVNGLNEKELRNAPTSNEVYNGLIKDLAIYVNKYDAQDKFFFIAYNAAFDYGFVRTLFERNGDKYFNSWFWHPYIDVMTLAANKLINQRSTLSNFKLATVANALEVDTKGRLHDALYDIKITKQLYEKIRGN